MRSVLKWFNTARRGANVIAEVEEALKLAGLKTEPVFAQASIDDPLIFVLQSPANGPTPDGSPTSEQSGIASAAPDDGAKPSNDGNDAAAAAG